MPDPDQAASSAAAPPASHEARPRDGIVASLLALERWARAAYLDHLGHGPRLAALDARLQHAYGLARRAGVVPIYLRQDLRLLRGACGAARADAAFWGRAHDLRTLVRVLFDGTPAEHDAGEVALPALLRAARAPSADLDLIVAATTPLLAGVFRRRGFVVIPAAVQLAATLATLRATCSRPSNSLQSDLLRVARAGYRLEPWSFSPERAHLFQRRYLEPYARARFAADASLPTPERIAQAYRRGIALAVLAPGSDTPELLCIVNERGRTLHLLRLGVRDGEHALLARGAVAALYALLPRFAEERGLQRIHVGSSRPWLDAGPLRFKWKWGYRPVRGLTQTLDWAVRVQHRDAEPVRRLLARRPLVRAPRGLVPLTHELLGAAGAR